MSWWFPQGKGLEMGIKKKNVRETKEKKTHRKIKFKYYLFCAHKKLTIIKEKFIILFLKHEHYINVCILCKYRNLSCIKLWKMN